MPLHKDALGTRSLALRIRLFVKKRCFKRVCQIHVISDSDLIVFVDYFVFVVVVSRSQYKLIVAFGGLNFLICLLLVEILRYNAIVIERKRNGSAKTFIPSHFSLNRQLQSRTF